MSLRFALFVSALCIAGAAGAQTSPWASAPRPVPSAGVASPLARFAAQTVAPSPAVSARAGSLAFDTYAGTTHSLGRLPLRFSFLGMPAAADLDGDGATDLLLMDVGSPDYGIEPRLDVYLSRPALDGGVGYAPSAMLAALDVSDWVGAPTLVDLDLDGDLDFVISVGSTEEVAPALVLYENVGSVRAPSFVRRVQSVVTGLRGFAFAADLDADGRTDLAVSRFTDTFSQCTATVHRNVGAVGAPSLGAADATPFPATLPSCVLSFLDADLDGDLDLATSFDAATYFLSNVGSPTAPQFVVAESPFEALGAMFSVGVALDLDADGRTDLAMVRFDEGGPSFEVYRHDAAATFLRERPRQLRASLGTMDAGLLEFGRGSFMDLDGDGDLDFVVGSTATETGGEAIELVAYRNDGTSGMPDFVLWTDSPVFRIGVVGDLPQPAFADIDGDGLTDLVVTYSDYAVAPVSFFKNIGTASAPVFERRPGPFGGFPAPETFGMTFGDIDGDGDLDGVAVGLTQTGVVQILALNVGTPTAPSFVYRQGAASGLPVAPAGHLYLPSLADLDGDGRPDIVVVDIELTNDDIVPSSLRAFRNTGGGFEAISVPAFEAYRGAGLLGPAVADLTGDGQPDLYVSSQSADFFLADVEVHWTLFVGVFEPLAGGERPGAASGLTVRHGGAHPARGTARVEISGAQGARSVEVFDVLGRVVARVEDAPETVEFAVGAWAPGRYAVRVRAGDAVAVLPLTVVR